MKLNVDVALNQRNNTMGYGWLVRDCKGKFVAACSVPWEGNYQVVEAEAMAIREALSWLKLKEMDKVQVETNALQLYQEIQFVLNLLFFPNVIFNDTKETILLSKY